MAISLAVEVEIRAVNHLSMVFSQVSRQTGEMNSQIKQMNTNISAMSRAWLAMFAGRELSRFGDSIVGALTKGVQVAGSFQTALVGIKIAANASTQAMDQLQNVLINTSNKYGMNLTQGANMMAISARGGMSISDIARQADPILGFGNLMNVTRGIPFEESALMASKLSGMFGHDVTDLFNRGIKSGKGNVDELFQIITKLAPVANALKMSPERVFELSALFENTGLGVRGSTSMVNALVSTTANAGKHNTRAKAARDLGLTDSHGNLNYLDAMGAPDPLLFGGILSSDRARMTTQRFQGDITGAFGGLRGVQVGEILSSPAVIEQFKALIERFKEMKTVTQDNNEITKTFDQQLKILGSNFQGLTTTAMMPLTNAATGAMKHLSLIVGKLTEVAEKSTGFKIVLDALIATAGALGITASVGGKVLQAGGNLALIKLALGGAGTAGAATGIGAGMAGGLENLGIWAYLYGLPALGGAAVGAAAVGVAGAAGLGIVGAYQHFDRQRTEKALEDAHTIINIEHLHTETHDPAHFTKHILRAAGHSPGRSGVPSRGPGVNTAGHGAISWSK